jgi:GNAT superfamily N-acetyltransferase
MRHRKGELVEVTVTYLEMEGRPAYPRPHLPVGPASALICAERPPAWYFLDLYDAVGRDYDWSDRKEEPRAELEAFLHDPAVALYSFVRAGWPHGFFVLDCRVAGRTDLAYLGLVPQAIGRGLGTFLLHTAVHMAWDRPGTRLVSVNTNTLDHPRALPLYQKSGFVPVRRATVRRVLSRDRNLIDA